jgi:ElaB/YqjD/DUF883 family membrane-anchored ribosome-binding protein
MSNTPNAARNGSHEAKASAARAKRQATNGIDSMLSDAQDKGTEALDAVREVGSNVVDAIDDSLAKRPHTTLLLAVAIGFLFGAAWRRS